MKKKFLLVTALLIALTACGSSGGGGGGGGVGAVRVDRMDRAAPDLLASVDPHGMMVQRSAARR